MKSLLFLGCGRIAKSHSKILRSVAPGLERSYASRSAERAAEFMKDVGGVASFGSYEEAIASSAEAVFICTPPSSHLELALRSLESGKHVIVEKPPFFTLADFDLAAETAIRHNRHLIVAENYFYKPLAAVLRQLLREDVVGSPLFLHINAIKRQKTDNWRDDPETAGGGALFEGGIHWVNLISNLGPRVVDVTGFRPGFRPGSQTGPDRSSLTVFRLEDGMVATLSYSWEVPSVFRGLRISRIFGTEGSITFETNGLFVIAAGRKKRVILPGLSDISGYRAMLEDFAANLDSPDGPRFTTEMARRDMALVEKAYLTMKPSAPDSAHE